VALGWGLWEGPARFIFGLRFFESRRSLSPTVPDNIAPLDFPKKWHNIRHNDELELICLRINEAPGHLGGRFATVAALGAHAVAFLAPPLEREFAAAIKNGLIKASAGR
jgi:hypothetical protein